MSGFFDAAERHAGRLAPLHDETARLQAESLADRAAKREQRKADEQAWLAGQGEYDWCHAPFYAGVCGWCDQGMPTYSRIVKVGGEFFHVRCCKWRSRCVCGAEKGDTPAEGQPVALTVEPCGGLCYGAYRVAGWFTGMGMRPEPIPKGFRR